MCNKVTIKFFTLILLFILGSGVHTFAFESNANARNPIIWSDVPDPSVIRVDNTYYMSSTTMHMNPGVPIMKSMDLINWVTVNYASDILVDTDALSLENGQNAYGKGSWASSIRHHNNKFYVVTFSYTTGKTHIYQTHDIENGPWSAHTLEVLCHDPSLLFDNDRVYIIYGVDDIKIIELTPDATAIQPGGLNQVLIPKASQIAGSNFYVPAEGSHMHKINGQYYVFLISWPAGSMRTELVYRAESLTGTYEGRIALRDDGVAQGGLVDTPEGDWYAVLFQDHGSVGRIPYLVPVSWEDDWPMFGVNGQLPDELDILVKNDEIPAIVASDEFDQDSELPLVWQWNHNPDNNNWSVTERPGFLRLTNGRIDESFVDTRNTLTQRTFGPECSGIIAMDISQLLDGDVAGLGVLQENYGYVGAKISGESKSIVMVNGNTENVTEIENIPIYQNVLYLQIGCDFKNKTDRAYFYYSLDGVVWNQIGNTLKMSYTLSHFMGYRFALFNFATETIGGYVDFDYFRINDALPVLSAVDDMDDKIRTEFQIYNNYPNPFNAATVIRYHLPVRSKINLKIYDLLGHELKTLYKGMHERGIYEAKLDGSELVSGIYLCRLSTDSYAITKRLLLIK